jgi:hypothetical protein
VISVSNFSIQALQRCQNYWAFSRDIVRLMNEQDDDRVDERDDTLQTRTIWLYLCITELTLFTTTSSIAILCALCFDRTYGAETTTVTPQGKAQSYCYLVAFITSVFTWIEISGRVICWRWIGYTDQRFWRLGIPAFMANALWAGCLLAMLPQGLQSRKDGSPPNAGDIRTLQVCCSISLVLSVIADMTLPRSRLMH